MTGFTRATAASETRTVTGGRNKAGGEWEYSEQEKEGKSKAFVCCPALLLHRCFMPAAIGDDLCHRKMWKNYGAHFHDDCLPCISWRYCTSDKKRAARGREGRTQVMHSTAIVHWALQKNIPYHCGRPYLVIQIINLTLKEEASEPFLSTSVPYIHTSQSSRWGKKRETDL